MTEFEGTGPVEAAAGALARACAGKEAAVSMAQRSPVGPRAVRVQPAEPDREACAALAACLDGEGWVETVVSRPKCVYVRVTTHALRTWVAEGLAGRAGGSEGDGQKVEVAYPEEGRSLHRFRERAAGRSIAAMLRSRGFEVAIGAREAGVSMNGKDVPVGEVDVRHGPLRARHGGSVDADDVAAELGGAHAEALLALVLLRTQRARRAQLDDDKLSREAAAFDALLAARRIADGAAGRAAPPAGDGDQAVRELAAELDQLPLTAARAAGALEPALVTRLAHSIAERSLAAEAFLPASDPLWSCAGEAIDVALTLAGVEVPRGKRTATSPAGVEPEKPRPWAGEIPLSAAGAAR
jgi:hypothetical protein